MDDRDKIRQELKLLMDALEKARANKDQQAIDLFTRDIAAELKKLGWGGN